LEAVADNQPIGLSELARLLELPKATVQRSLATLADVGWIRPEGREPKRWMLGERLRTLAEKVDDIGRLRDAALPAIGRLNDETLETIHLAVPDVRTMRLVERMDSKHPLRLVQPIGTRVPMHASSTGKAMLAYLPEREIEHYIDGGLPLVAANTIVDPEAFRAELKKIREQGFAVALEELADGIVSVAASIRPGDRGRPVASMSISGPSARITQERRESYGRKIVRAVADVSARLTN
jgi:IclR family acetate operon transcriptional repressor